MAYNDPYYSSPQPFQQRYQDGPDFDPYNTRQPHPTYEQGAYTDDDAFAPPPPAKDAPGEAGKERGAYEDAGFPPALRPPKSTGAIRIWRRDHHGNLWTKGSRGRCIGRFCCCSLLIVLFLIVSIVLALGIWIRPPNISFNNVGFPSNGSTFQVTSDSLNLNLGVNISVDNPNYFAVAFNDIKADLTYPINNTDVGGGEKDNIVFHARTQTTFDFPFTLTYKTADDPTKAVLTDLLAKCGIPSGTKSDIVVKYKITLGLKILFVTISPTISNNFSFPCPVSEADLAALLEGSGLNIAGITGQ